METRSSIFGERKPKNFRDEKKTQLHARNPAQLKRQDGSSAKKRRRPFFNFPEHSQTSAQSWIPGRMTMGKYVLSVIGKIDIRLEK
jgi:hypothetical protein